MCVCVRESETETETEKGHRGIRVVGAVEHDRVARRVEPLIHARALHWGSAAEGGGRSVERGG